MTKRDKDTAWYNHPFVMKQSAHGKLLYDWLTYNSDVPPSGIYKVSLEAIAFQLKIDAQEIPDLLKQLEPNIVWYPEYNLIWHKEFLNNQTTAKCTKFLEKVAQSLKNIHYPEIIKEFLDYNSERYGIEIPYKIGATAPKEKPQPQSAPIIIDEKLKQIVEIYESNIAMVTPMTVETLKDTSDKYSVDWFNDAVKEAVGHNKRNLKYVEAILKRWETEGRDRTHKGRPGEIPQQYKTPEQLDEAYHQRKPG